MKCSDCPGVNRPHRGCPVAFGGFCSSRECPYSLDDIVLRIKTLQTEQNRTKLRIRDLRAVLAEKELEEAEAIAGLRPDDYAHYEGPICRVAKSDFPILYEALSRSLSAEPITHFAEVIHVFEDEIEEIFQTEQIDPDTPRPQTQCPVCRRKGVTLLKDYCNHCGSIGSYIVCRECQYLNDDAFWQLNNASLAMSRRLVIKLLREGQAEFVSREIESALISVPGLIGPTVGEPFAGSSKP